MKSNKAKRHIFYGEDFRIFVDGHRIDDGRAIAKVEAAKAVELAETDARERAIKALCHQSCYGTCPLVVPHSGCGKMNAFLGFYDKTE